MVQSNASILDTETAKSQQTHSAFAEALCGETKWGELEEFLASTKAVQVSGKMFYLQLARLMRILEDPRGSGSPIERLNQCVPVVRNLISSPMTVSQLMMLLDVDVFRKMFGLLPSANSEVIARQIDSSERELEIRVAVEAEVLIGTLEAQRRDATEFKQRLNEMELGRGSWQLLSDLNRSTQSMAN